MPTVGIPNLPEVVPTLGRHQPRTALPGTTGDRAVPGDPTGVPVSKTPTSIGLTGVGRWGTGTAGRLLSGHYQAPGDVLGADGGARHRSPPAGRRFRRSPIPPRASKAAAPPTGSYSTPGPSAGGRPGSGTDRRRRPGTAASWTTTSSPPSPAGASTRSPLLTSRSGSTSSAGIWRRQRCGAPTVLDQLLEGAVDAGLLAAANARTRLPRRERYEARFLTATELEHVAATIRPPWRPMGPHRRLRHPAHR